MLYSQKSVTEKRNVFASKLISGQLLRFPGAFSPLVAKLIEEVGFDGVYVSGAVVANSLGLPDVGLTSLTEVAKTAGEIARVSDLPCIADADTGFGEPINVARTIQQFEDAGLCGFHIEDQHNPKRCGHLDHKLIVPTEDMVKKIHTAFKARREPSFQIIARTDARASEGLPATIDRAKAYVDAGADIIFPEALEDESEFEAMRKAIDVPLLANMTEFGKSKLLDAKVLESLGFNMVIYPVTTLRLAMKAVEDGLIKIISEGTQASLLPQMQSRARLYELLDYEAYTSFDTSIYNFSLTNGGKQ